MKQLLLTLTVLLFTLPAIAQDAKWHDDRIVLQLTAEDYVTASTARVIVNVVASLKGDAAQTRKDILAAADKIAKGANWRIINFNNSTDQAGLERWDAALEARLPEVQLSGLNNAAKAASRPGLQFTVGSSDLTPTLDELETGRAKLRETLLKKAQDELARLNKAAGKTYRLADINFMGGAMPLPQPQYMAKTMRAAAPEMAMAADAAAGSGGFSTDNKIQMSATVVLGVKITE